MAPACGRQGAASVDSHPGVEYGGSGSRHPTPDIPHLTEVCVWPTAALTLLLPQPLGIASLVGVSVFLECLLALAILYAMSDLSHTLQWGPGPTP